MKPTQEQVIEWAREAGVYHIAPNVTGSLLYMSQASLYRGFFLAYEAGRRDENEACAKLVVQCSWNVKGAENALLVDGCAAAIRARREQ